MVGYTTITFSFNHDGHYIFPLNLFISELTTQNLLGLFFWRQHVSGIHFHMTEIEIKKLPKFICFGSSHQNKPCIHSSRILIIRSHYTMYIDAKSARVWNFSPADSHTHFPQDSMLQPNRIAVSAGLSFKTTLCIQSEYSFQILMGNNKNHQITVLRGIIDSSRDVLWIMINPNTRNGAPTIWQLLSSQMIILWYNRCFLHSTITGQTNREPR